MYHPFNNNEPSDSAAEQQLGIAISYSSVMPGTTAGKGVLSEAS